MTKRKIGKIKVPVSDWFKPIWTVEHSARYLKIQAMRQAGATVKIEFHPDNYTDRRYVAVFHTKDQAALFKLKHL